MTLAEKRLFREIEKVFKSLDTYNLVNNSSGKVKLAYAF